LVLGILYPFAGILVAEMALSRFIAARTALQPFRLVIS
jgi:hypothetical protein